MDWFGFNGDIKQLFKLKWNNGLLPGQVKDLITAIKKF